MEAIGEDGFTVATEVMEAQANPTVEYVITKASSGSASYSATLGKAYSVDDNEHNLGCMFYALNGLTFTTAAGQAPTMTASGTASDGRQYVPEDYGVCYATVSLPNVDNLFHAQTFGLFSYSNGQLVNSSLAYNADIGLGTIDGVIRTSDTTNVKVTLTGTLIGVKDDGTIATPSLSIQTNVPSRGLKGGVLTQPLTQTNPNGDFPQYTFTAQWFVESSFHGSSSGC